jgi:hypothetical protein
MSTDIVRATPFTASLPDMVRYAEHLAEADMLPKGFVGRPANVLYAMEYGRTLGITPIAALTGIHVIEGKPSASSGLIGALVRQAGHKLRIKGDGRSATAQIIRADDPDWTYEVTWTLERAEQAGLCQLKDGKPWARDRNGKPTAWEKYPAAMLKARAITEVARDACEDVLFGLHYTPEELGAYVDQDGNPVDAPVQPLRAVQAESVAPARPSTAQVEVPPATDTHKAIVRAVDVAERAAKAATLEAWRALWAEASSGSLLDAPIVDPDGDRQLPLGEYLTRRGVELKSGPATAGQPADGIADAEIVGEPDEHTVALGELRAAALAAGIAPTLDTDFKDSYGITPAEASVEQLRQMTAILTGAAA